MSVVNICGIKIDNISFMEAIERIEGFVRNRSNAFVVTPNVDHIVKLQSDLEFNKIYRDAQLVLTDGVPLLWAAKFLGTPIKERTSGSDLCLKLCEISANKGYSLFFLGGREGAALSAAERLKKKYPTIKIVGTYCPPRDFETDSNENKKIKNLIRTAMADILFVGLGAPKQEKWIYKHFKELGIPVSIGVGVTFEFIAGTVKRAPKWMQRIGLEWLWRLMMEPTRLWRRYLVEDIKFFRLILSQRLKKEISH